MFVNIHIHLGFVLQSGSSCQECPCSSQAIDCSSTTLVDSKKTASILHKVELSSAMPGTADQSHNSCGDDGAGDASARLSEKPAVEQAPAESSMDAAEAVLEAEPEGATPEGGVTYKDFARPSTAGPAEDTKVIIEGQGYHVCRPVSPQIPCWNWRGVEAKK